jgi:hypothetical protein
MTVLCGDAEFPAGIAMAHLSFPAVIARVMRATQLDHPDKPGDDGVCV